MQPLQRVGVVLLQEEQVLLRAVQLILQGQVGRRHGSGRYRRQPRNLHTDNDKDINDDDARTV